MAIEIKDATIELWIRDGVQTAINSMMRDGYGTGAKLKSAMEKAIAESQEQITVAMVHAIAKACVSPNFLMAIEKDIATALASQYRGAFEGVIRAAAKQAAHTDVVAQRVIEMTRKAAGVE